MISLKKAWSGSLWSPEQVWGDRAQRQCKKQTSQCWCWHAEPLALHETWLVIHFS